MRSTRSSEIPLTEPIEEIDRVYHRRKRLVAQSEVVDDNYSDSLQGIF